jgi:hypothetical protein
MVSMYIHTYIHTYTDLSVSAWERSVSSAASSNSSRTPVTPTNPTDNGGTPQSVAKRLTSTTPTELLTPTGFGEGGMWSNNIKMKHHGDMQFADARSGVEHGVHGSSTGDAVMGTDEETGGRQRNSAPGRLADNGGNSRMHDDDDDDDDEEGGVGKQGNEDREEHSRCGSGGSAEAQNLGVDNSHDDGDEDAASVGGSNRGDSLNKRKETEARGGDEAVQSGSAAGGGVADWDHPTPPEHVEDQDDDDVDHVGKKQRT